MTGEDTLKEVWYAGHADGSVTVIHAMTETPLPHHVKHSPTGFGWGYGGSGPAELARCLLIHALGEDAKCKTCAGTGSLVYVPAADKHMPIEEAEADYTGWDPNDTVSCWECEDGIGVLPAMYQQFKFDVVAQFPAGEPWKDTEVSTRDDGTIEMRAGREDRWLPWSLPQSEILAWHRRYQLKAVNT
jgi:hypothetical protein